MAQVERLPKDIQCYAHRSNNDVDGHEVLPLSAA